MLEALAEIVTIFASAFAGAWAAFLFERWRKKQDERQEHHGLLRNAHFVLIQQLVDLTSLDRQFLQHFRLDPNRWSSMPPMKALAAPLQLETGQLLFLLKSDSPDLINRLHVGGQKFRNFVEVVHQRAELHMRLQERISTLQQEGFFKRDDLHQHVVEEALGLNLVAQLKDLTNYIFEEHPDMEGEIRKNLEDLEAFLRHSYPKERAPSYQLLQADEQRVHAVPSQEGA